MDYNQEKLMEMVVDKVLKKHKVKIEKNALTDEEKEEIKNVVEKIKQDVECFLQNQAKTKTEKDFQQTNASRINDNVYSPNTVYRNPNARRIYSEPNDIKTVKHFYKKK